MVKTKVNLTEVFKQFYSKRGSRVTKRKANKVHDCIDCERIIKAGEDYQEITFVKDKGWQTIRVCLKCWRRGKR